MALILHKVFKDGSFEHEEFTRATWEAALKNKDLARRWGHAPDDCDPNWLISSKLEETIKMPPPREEVEWPPEVELKPWMLRELTTMCLEDAEDVLRAPRKSEPTPTLASNRRGQLMLF